MDAAKLRAMSLAGPADFGAYGAQPVEVDVEDGYFKVKVSPLEGDRMRQLLGVRYHRNSDTWVAPATRAQAAGLSGIFDGRLDPTPAAKEYVADLFNSLPSSDRSLPTPMWYSGPHDPTTAVPHNHMRVLLGGVPSVEPATEEVLSVLLAEGTQYPGTQPGGRPQGEAEVRGLSKADVRRVREALRAARTQALGRVGLGSSSGTRGDRPSCEPQQVGQPAGEPGSDDTERAHSGTPALFAFQQTDVGFVGNAGSALLGSQMGCGKSLVGAQFVWHHGGPGLIVCPTSMKYKWAAELEAWAPGMDVVVIDGSAAKRRKQIAEAPDNTVFIVNFESLRTHTRLAPWGGKALSEKQKEHKELNDWTWSAVVVDEAHKIKDPKSQQSMAVKQMGLQSQHRLAMTGTPLINDPDDLWSIMNFVAPDEYGSRNQFRSRYCIMQSAWHGGFQNTGLKQETREEFDRFFMPRFLRRTKEEVLPDLPEKFEIDYRVLPMGTQQAKVYNALAKDMMALTEDELLIAENPLSLTIRLRQAASGVPIVEDGEVVALGTPSNKLDAIEDILAEAPGDPLVVYAESRKFIEMLHGALTFKGYSCELVTGKQGAAMRERAVERFQKGHADILLGTLGAGAEGLTLTRANRIILAQQSWSHAVNAQAIDRVHRIGQTRGVQPIVLVSKDTIDEATAVVDRTKEGRLQQLVRDPKWLAAAVKGQIHE